MEELLSVIVPVYRVEEYLDRCLNSITNQTYKNLEIVLIDDGSPDACPFICDEWEKKDRRIRVIHRLNGGLAAARNEGLRVAKGEYVLYVDSDDFLELDACERLTECIKRTQCDFVVGNLKEVSERGEIITVQRHSNLPTYTALSNKEYIIRSIEANEWYAPAVLNLYKREFLLENNLTFKEGRIFEDTEMLPRLCFSAKKISYIDYSFYNYCVRNESIVRSSTSPQKVESALKNYEEWKELFDQESDRDFQRKLYGVLVKQYLYACRTLKITGWRIKGVDFLFGIKNGLNIMEKLKVLFFTICPGLYIG